MIDKIFDQMAKDFSAAAIDRDISFFFIFEDRRKTVFIGPQGCRIEDGKAIDSADCVCKTSTEFFLRIWQQGYRPGIKDFLGGEIRSNDPQALQTFLAAFGKPA